MPKAQSTATHVRSRQVAFRGVFMALAGIFAFASAAMADAVKPAKLAIANFAFRDTSGEVRDQTAEHEARLKAFGVALQASLSEKQKFGLVALACQTETCTARDPGIDNLLTQARTVGARYLVVGEVHKMSTLVGWASFAVLDLNDNKPTCDRFLTYRGDTDEAWLRAAKSVARDVANHCIP